MNNKQLLTFLAQFEPKLRPLIPDTLAALAVVQRIRLVTKPVQERMALGEPAFLEMISVAPTLQSMQVDIARAMATFEKLGALAQAWEAKPLEHLEKVKMDWNTLNGILRALVPAALAYAVGKGWVSSSSVADITAAITAIVAAGWSVVTNKPTTTS